MNPSERAAAGRAARAQAPFGVHEGFTPADGRPDPVAVLIEQEQNRLPELLPIRHARMSADPFAFYRGSAAVMAADLAAAPSSGLHTQLCGDAHLANFGMFASPERRLVFDLNDFDETHPGPFEWDLKRLVASLALAARANGLKRKERAVITGGTARAYREAMASFATMRELDLWYAHAAVDELQTRLDKTRAKKVAAAGAKARARTSLQASRKLTEIVDGRPRIVADPPLLVPLRDLVDDATDLETRLPELLAEYRDSLPHDRRRLLDAFTYVDMARKVVGVGSVGTRCWIVLLTGRDHDDPLLLQVKESGPSVLADHVKPNGAPGWASHGQRVVHGQQLMQAVSDIFLGWQSYNGRDFYVRQLRDWKGSVDPAQLKPEGLRLYGEICAWTLARAHARGGDRIAIAAYLGSSDKMDRALVRFAEDYADQTERDHAAFTAAVASGTLATAL
ncbi:DUF2252 domain-containing protein, partial [Paractinoplanes deccanensis]|uniref:DUF2252 domain-containing protein n=1 Tax=Paractinoplanes deccanensis TaxID=113561 RepID=UPI001943B3E3